MNLKEEPASESYLSEREKHCLNVSLAQSQEREDSSRIATVNTDRRGAVHVTISHARRFSEEFINCLPGESSIE